MAQQPKMTNEEVLDVLIEHGLTNVDFIKSEDSFYRYVDGHLEFIDPELDLPTLINRTLINLKREGLLQSSLNINPALVEAVIKQLKWMIQNVHTSIDSPYLCFTEDDTLLDTSSSTFTRLPTDRALPSFIYFPYASSILDDPTPPKRFLELLEYTFEDQEMTNFFQLLLGYCLLDCIEAHAVFFFYGGGQNGKSVLLDIIRGLLPEPLIGADKLQDLTSNRFRIANLVGKRLNVAGEEESKYLKADLFKDISSGEVVTGERKFQGTFKFRPKVKMIFATQKIPTFDAVDKAMRRRVFIIPFTKTVPDDKRIPFLAKKILAEERPQIIAWALEGAKHIIEREFKFPRPAAIAQATKQQEQNTSSTLQFFNDNFKITGSVTDVYPKAHTYTLYTHWCEEENRQRVSKQRFFQELEQRYKDEGLSIPETPVWDPKLKSTTRSMLGVVPTDDGTAFINNFAKPGNQLSA
jgi:P4 family phage/plasmid primase-like protien